MRCLTGREAFDRGEAEAHGEKTGSKRRGCYGKSNTQVNQGKNEVHG